MCLAMVVSARHPAPAASSPATRCSPPPARFLKAGFARGALGVCIPEAELASGAVDTVWRGERGETACCRREIISRANETMCVDRRPRPLAVPLRVPLPHEGARSTAL